MDEYTKLATEYSTKVLADAEKPLHTVVATNGERLWIVTAYYPSHDKWMDDLKTRKEE